jgi:Flp pilus assembly protein TadD
MLSARRAQLCLIVLLWSVTPLPGIVAAPADAQVEAVLASAAEAENAGDVQLALERYRKADEIRPSDPKILQKISKQLSDSANDLRDTAARRERIEEALAVAQRAAELSPNDPACVLSIAICYGKLALYVETGKRIDCARCVKEFADKALALDPNYHWTHHVLGRWHCEMLQIGGPSRALARVFYGAIPTGSADEAVRHLQRAAELSPNVAAHTLELGFAFLAAGRRNDAIEAFRRGMQLPPKEKQDQISRARAAPVLARLESESRK